MKYSRWMTPDAKAEILAQWERWKAEPLPTDRGYLGGLGFPDPEIFGWCDRLNALPGVCTLQSCAGHRHPEGYVWNGQLWLWLDRRISMAFDARAFELVECPFIERVNRIYHDDGQEIADVIFRGAATGDLERSLLHIDMFFHDLEDLALQVEGPR